MIVELNFIGENGPDKDHCRTHITPSDFAGHAHPAQCTRASGQRQHDLAVECKWTNRRGVIVLSRPAPRTGDEWLAWELMQRMPTAAPCPLAASCLSPRPIDPARSTGSVSKSTIWAKDESQGRASYRLAFDGAEYR